MIALTHVHSIRLKSGEEALVARVVTDRGRVGYGFSFRLDATEARRMAAWNAGAIRQNDWSLEPAFSALRWIP